MTERERARAAAEDQQFAVADDAKSVWEPVFDEADERTGGREYYDVTEGSARQRIQRRREKDDPRRRDGGRRGAMIFFVDRLARYEFSTLR